MSEPPDPWVSLQSLMGGVCEFDFTPIKGVTGRGIFVRASRRSGAFRVEQVDAVIYDEDHVAHPATLIWSDIVRTNYERYLEWMMDEHRVDPIVGVARMTHPESKLIANVWGGDILGDAYITNETWADVVGWFEPHGYKERVQRRKEERRRASGEGMA